jgi:hypothetical protein
MPNGLPDPGQIWEDFINNPIVQLAGQLIVVYVVMLWLGTAYWAFRDMQARTENPILPYFAAALIIFFTPLLFVFAVILYLIVRPRETMAEVYERSLAEESLLAEVEKNELCPVWRVVVPVDTSVHHAPAEVDRYAWTPWREFADDAQRDPSLVSPWCALQVDELAGLGDDPLSWPVSDVEALPLAAAVR